jgi:hypothetical protein
MAVLRLLREQLHQHSFHFVLIGAPYLSHYPTDISHRWVACTHGVCYLGVVCFDCKVHTIRDT